jgi:hypothetical protein
LNVAGRCKKTSLRMCGFRPYINKCLAVSDVTLLAPRSTIVVLKADTYDYTLFVYFILNSLLRSNCSRSTSLNSMRKSSTMSVNVLIVNTYASPPFDTQ